jgi:preprotein translocase subunit SecA
MGRDDVSDTVSDLRTQVVQELVGDCIPPNAYAEQWDTAELKTEVDRIFGLDLPIDRWAAEEGIADQEITERLLREVEEKAKAKEAEFGAPVMRQIEKMVLLQTLDHLWREHLVTLEHLRQVIGFRSYGQRDPLNEYKSEGFQLFETMLANLREAVTGQLMHIQGMPEEDEDLIPAELPPMQAHRGEVMTEDDEEELAMANAVMAAASAPQAEELGERASPVQKRKAAAAVDRGDPATWGKVGRNEKCPCGSGKKFKHCHGRHD